MCRFGIQVFVHKLMELDCAYSGTTARKFVLETGYFQVHIDQRDPRKAFFRSAVSAKWWNTEAVVSAVSQLNQLTGLVN
jgi:hypothetical protein